MPTISLYDFFAMVNVGVAKWLNQVEALEDLWTNVIVLLNLFLEFQFFYH